MPRHAGMLQLRPTPPSCAPNSTFVSLLSNESWVPGALCLLKAMAAVRSVCPLLLVVDDVTHRGSQVAVPEAALSTLRSAFGASSVVPLSRLTERIDRYSGAPAAGRRLKAKQAPHPSGWVQNTHGKLLLWALPGGYQRACFLDLDMAVVGNMDALLYEQPFAAVAAMPYSSRLFNSGVFVFEPSVKVASELATLSRATDSGTGGKSSSVKIRPAMELRGTTHLSDQSVLNHYYRDRWRALPYGYNAGKKIYMAKRDLWNQMQLGAIHFVGRPKPWDVPHVPNPSAALLRSKLDATPLYNRWHEQCTLPAAH